MFQLFVQLGFDQKKLYLGVTQQQIDRLASAARFSRFGTFVQADVPASQKFIFVTGKKLRVLLNSAKANLVFFPSSTIFISIFFFYQNLPSSYIYIFT